MLYIEKIMRDGARLSSVQKQNLIATCLTDCHEQLVQLDQAELKPVGAKMHRTLTMLHLAVELLYQEVKAKEGPDDGKD